MIKLWIYKHYSSDEKKYEVIGIANHSETLEKMVVYRALYKSKSFWEDSLWIRPLSMFQETVRVDGETVPRFKLIEQI